ncbi:helix-turn-helix domain-containing protein [Streptomyces poriticola]|uniref:helix-turn-helix domain-containing protein n=1 Tax=Streptomyces poriticola TaxID=3120506 RepID=UPI002FCE53EF
MTVEQPHFGQQVRQIRRAQGLSQSDLAGDTMSPSYISLVESGRRAPSLKLARAIAERLDMPVEVLLAPQEPEQHPPHRLGVVGRLVAARAHQLAGDWDVAHDELTGIIALPGGPELDDVRWEARWELATTLGRLGKSEAREQTLRDLLADPLTKSSPLLHIRVAVETAQALKDVGNLTESARFAEEALRLARTAEPPALVERAQAETVLVSVCTASGDWERSRELADGLVRTVQGVPGGRLRATGLWAAAGAHYVNGRAKPALALMAEAEQTMAQAGDLPLRARLQLAAGLLYIADGRLDAADPLLRQAAQAAELVGTPEDGVRLAAARALASLRRDDPAEAGRQGALVDAGLSALAVLDRARCTVVTARIHRARGEEDTARERFHSAAALYEEAGAYRIAVTVWRELSAADATAGATAPGIDPHVLLMP